MESLGLKTLDNLLVVRPQAESLLDTIAALATPTGRSALALLRVSGREAQAILRKVARGLPEPPLRARHCYLVSFGDAAGATLDRGLATFFAEPESPTGEDVAELSIHGSPVVAEKLLAALVAAGARLARPGEFTERAFLLGKLDLMEAEAVRDLIEARTAAAAHISARRLEGKLSERLAAVREDLLAGAAALAATIDFSEDVGETVSPETAERLRRARAALTCLSQSYGTGRLLSAGCRVVILGPPNAGKSTLFNALLGSSRAIVTDVPGTTRDTLEATVDIAGIPVELVDTAGLRETEDRVEKIGVERAREAGKTSDAVLYVFDARAGWSEDDEKVVGALAGRPVIVVANKMDTVSTGAPARPHGAHPLTGTWPDAGTKLQALLRETLAAGVQTEATSEVLGSLRQKDLVDRAGACVEETLESLGRGDSPEYAAAHLNAAIDALADLFGETTAEDVLGRIFSKFCIGK